MVKNILDLCTLKRSIHRHETHTLVEAYAFRFTW